MFFCNSCSYSTLRKFNLQLHINRKKSCKKPLSNSSHSQEGQNVNPRVDIEGSEGQNVNPRVDIEGQNVNPRVDIEGSGGQNVNPKGQNVKCDKSLSCEKSLRKHENVCNGVDTLQCPTCQKRFNNRQAKHKHVNNVKCESPENILHLEEENERLRRENELLKSNKPIIINNTTNNNIQINNYDNPNIDHMTNKVIRRMYYKSKQDAHMMILEAIRTIFKNENIPQNDSIRLIEGSKSKFAQVQKDDEKIILPLVEVLETLLTKSSEVCGDGLRECEEEGTIHGIRCSFVKSLMETLATDDREGDKENRAKYLPYVKSALL